MQASSKSQLHPDYRNALNFVCTSLDEFIPGCGWDKEWVYRKQVSKEVEAAAMWVERFINDKNWPTVEWDTKDLSTLCVVVPNKHVVSSNVTHSRLNILCSSFDVDSILYVHG